MKRATKIWIAAATLSILIGGLIFVGAMHLNQWDFTKLSTGKFVTSTHRITESFNQIDIEADTAVIDLLPSQNGECTVICYERENEVHSAEVTDGVLTIRQNDTRKWYERIGINLDSPKITVYIPSGEYGKLSIETDTGSVSIPSDLSFAEIDVSADTGSVSCRASVNNALSIESDTGNIKVEGITAGSISLSVDTGMITATDVVCESDVLINVSTGRVKLERLSCRNLTSEGSTGDISLKGVIAEGKLTVTRSTGDVSFDGSDAGEIFVETGTGNVTGTLLTDKIFLAEADTGRVRVPSTATGGRCEITTDTGNIIIEIK